MSQEIICNLLKAVLNFSDLNDSFCLACNDSGMVPLFVDMIKELKDEDLFVRSIENSMHCS